MTSAKNQRRSRAQILARLWDLGREMSTQTVFLHQAIAQGFGLNATDTKCVDLIMHGPPGGATAGWLSATTGLTTGAVTHILDRLEKRGFIARRRDTADRRKIFIEVRPEALKPLIPRYEAIGKVYMKHLDQYTDAQLHLICQYLEETSELSRAQLARLISESNR